MNLTVSITESDTGQGIDSSAPGQGAGRSQRDPASRRTTPPTSRRLHLGHFAFMRAVLQGLDTRASWDRYLRLEGDPGDARVVRQTIQWIRDEFAVAARRFSRHGTARLVLIDASRVADKQMTLPTLDEFSDLHQLHGFSHAEQLEQYEEHYGKATQRQSRRSRLLARQLDALHWLEGIAVRPPQPADAVAAWLHPDLAARVEGSGILTLQQLAEYINGIGRRWWAGIPAIGVAKAGRIEDWLRQQQPALGLSIGAHVARNRSTLGREDLLQVMPRATAIVPFDKLIIPPALDGSSGVYRAPIGARLIDPHNDREAVLAWLDNRAPDARSHTRRAYLKEAERFMLWAVVKRKKPLSSMTTEDCLTYCRFLENPAPSELWCGRRGREKWSPLWRPFEGPLSIRAQRQTITILKSLYKFLTQRHYLNFNAWETVALPEEVVPRVNTARCFTRAQWSVIEQRLATLPDTSANRRLKLSLPLLYSTGMRLAEAVAATLGDLRREATDGNDRMHMHEWQLTVAGQGVRQRIITVPDHVMDALSAYLISRDLPADPAAAENRDAAILGKAVDVAERAPWSARARKPVDPKEGIAPGTLYDQLKEFFASCAADIQNDARTRRTFESASTQWLRHTHALHRAGK